MSKTDPFTRTPGIAGKAYIDNGTADEIIAAFNSNESAKYVYKITGIRGAGKSVEYGKVIRTLKSEKDWLVYTLSATGDMLTTLISKISMERFINSKVSTTQKSSTTSVGGSAFVVSGNESVSVSTTSMDNDHYYSDEAALTQMVLAANKKHYKVLVGIDDISRTPDSVKLLSIIGSMILEGYQIYLLVTGLNENIEDFTNEKSLSFFKRADSKEIKTLNRYDIVLMYEKLLGIDAIEAKRIEGITNGYAYAYQVLGSLYFNKQPGEKLEDIIPEFEHIMFRDSYDLVWRSLTDGERDLVRCVYKSGTGKTSDIKALMKIPNNYSVYRSRLIKKHLIDGSKQGYINIILPHFDRFIEIWGDDFG